MDAYAEVLARLVGARRFGVVLGLDRMRALLDRLGRPQDRLGTVVHVGGTNGKGSTAAMIGALAREGGRRTAVYSSPHLTTIRERIVVDDELVSEAQFVAAAEVVADAGGGELTFFEQVTAIALCVFAAAQPGVTVLEVGLGGRLDATNVVDAAVAVVTGVALDHQAILGDTLAAIAAEKAGIFKPGQDIVIGCSGEPAAVPALATAARAVGRSVTVVDPRQPAAQDALGALALPGPHQRRNARAALAAVDALERRGVVAVSSAERRAALARVRHPGRFEIVLGDPDIILDGAHNPHGAKALADALRERGLRPTVVLGVSADKDVTGIVRALAPVASTIVATRYRQDRALEPEALATLARAYVEEVAVAPDLVAALAIARGRPAALGAPVQRSIVIAGSLFLVGEARTLLCAAPTDPVIATDPVPAAPAR